MADVRAQTARAPQPPRTNRWIFLGGEIDGRCIAEAVVGLIVSIVIQWFILGNTFVPYPPDCYQQDEGVMSINGDRGMLTITNKTAEVRSWIDTPGLKVQYENVTATLRYGVEDDALAVTHMVYLPDVDQGYKRFNSWLINFQAKQVPIKPRNISVHTPMTLEMDMTMKWYSFWSFRSGTFENVKIVCPINPARINTPIECVSSVSSDQE